MKYLRKLISVVALTLIVSFSVAAGDMHTPAPPPPAGQSVSVKAAAKESVIPASWNEATASLVTQLTAELLESVLSLF